MPRKRKFVNILEKSIALFMGITTPMVRPDYNGDLIVALQKLLICRDAYWKVGKPWTPQDTNTFSIFYDRLTGEIEKQDGYCGANSTLEFSTAEMRDAFYENFKGLIEQCKELL